MTVEDQIRFVRVDRGNKQVLDVVDDDVFDAQIDPVLLDLLLGSGQLVVVATKSGTVVGQIQAMIHHHLDGPPQLYIDNLGVSPQHQREGIAGALVNEAIVWSSELGCREAWVLTEIDNEAANALYSSIGAEKSTVALFSLQSRT